MIGLAAIAQRVAGGGVLEAEAGDDVAGHGDVEVFALVGVHQQDAAEALAALLGGVVDLVALVDLAAVDPEVGQLAERVGDDLERQRGERLVARRLAVEDLVLVVRLGALRRRDVERARQEVDDGVEHRLDALVLERRAAQDRHEVERQRAGADGATLISSSVTSSPARYFSIRWSSLVAMVSSSCSRYSSAWSTMSAGMSTSSHLAPSSSSCQMRAFILTRSTRPMNGLLDSGPPAPTGRWITAGRRLQAGLHHVDGAVEVGADAVHLVDEAHARDLVLVGLTPHGLGLRLDAGDRVEHGDGAVEDAQRALDLDGEVDVAGGVDDVDAVVVPDAGGGSGGDGDAALLLLRHVVHGGGAVVDLADLVALARVVEDALGRGGLARVDVGHDADVAGALEWEFALGHLSTSLSGSCCQVASLRGGYAGPIRP